MTKRKSPAKKSRVYKVPFIGLPFLDHARPIDWSAKRSFLRDAGYLTDRFQKNGPLSLDDLVVDLFDRVQFGHWDHEKVLALFVAFCDGATSEQLIECARWMRRERAIVELYAESAVSGDEGPTEAQITERMLTLGPLG